MKGFGLMVQGVGFGVKSLGFRVQGGGEVEGGQWRRNALPECEQAGMRVEGTLHVYGYLRLLSSRAFSCETPTNLDS